MSNYIHLPYDCIGKYQFDDPILSTNELDDVVDGLIAGVAEISSDFLDKKIGGSVSGDVEVAGHELKVLSGNYYQSDDSSGHVKNYSYKNSFLQAEYVSQHPEWGIACTGSKGYCVLSVIKDDNALKLSGDIS